jgi:hypothetical protein
MLRAIDCEDFIKVYPEQQKEYADWIVEYVTHRDNVPICPAPYQMILASCRASNKDEALFIADAMAKGRRVNVDYTPLTIKQKESDNE